MNLRTPALSLSNTPTLDHAWGQPDLAARQHDAALRMRIAKLQFINPDHLDIPAGFRHEAAWGLAIQSLQAMSLRCQPLSPTPCTLRPASGALMRPHIPNPRA